MKKLVILTLACLLGGHLFSQSVYPDVGHPEFFKTIPPIDETTPDWAVMMYGPDPNLFEVTSAFIKYYEENEYVKTVHGQNYKYWLRTAGEYVNAEGFIRPPSREEEDALARKLERRRSENLQRNMMGWTSIGPFETYHSGSLEPTSNQANVYSLDQSASNPDILFAGTESGAMFKSTDHGLNWSPTSYDQPFSGGFGGLEIHPTNPDLVITAVNKRIYRTTDGGATWTEEAYLGALGYEIKFRPSNPDSVFCAGANGLYLSTDAGDTWSVPIFGEACYDLDWHTISHDTLYLLKANPAAVRAELFMSADGGATWNLKDNGYYSPSDPANAGISGGKIALTAADPDRIYVALIGADKADDNGWIGVVRSNDRGENWTVPAGQYGGPYQSINTMPWNVAAYSGGYHQGFYNFDFEASPNNPDLIWVGTIRLSESSDGGATFTAIGAANSQRLGNVHADIQDIEVNGNEVWVANDGGIEHSPDALQSSTSRKKGIAGSNFWGFGTGWNQDVFTGGLYHNGNATYFQAYGVGNSIKLGGVEEPTGYINPLNNQLAYHGYGSTTDVRSVPDAIGEDYRNYADLAMKPNESYSDSYSSGLYFDPRYADHMYLGNGSSVWKSTDAGITFQEIHNLGTGGRVLEMVISRKNPDYLYAVFVPDDGSYWNWREIHRTTDGGATWNQLTAVPASSRAKLEITLNPDDENEIWVAAFHGNNSGKVFKSTDGGTNWTNMTTTTLNDEKIIDLKYQGGTDDLVYALSENTLFYYDQTQNDWVDYGTGLPFRPRSFRIEPFYRDGKLRLATGGHGIWETALAGTSQPLAQPITFADSLFCAKDTVQFDCYSILAHAGATWQWAFDPAPLWVSSTTARNPRVVFGQNGNYDVTLTVMDGNSNSSTKTIADMVKVDSRCEADTLAGQALTTVANGDYFISQNANLTNLTHFTVTGWWKPDGAQQAYAALFSSGDWCAHCDDTEGLIFNYYGDKLWYKWPGMADNWGSSSGIDIPLDEWSYVALVIEPTQATLYLNDQKYVHTKALGPGEIESIYIGYGHYSKSFKGDIDEVTMWRKALPESEIRRLRHLTKEDEIGADPDLIGYWQFNERVRGNQVMDMAGKYHGVLNAGSALEASTVPVGGGASQIMDLAGGQNRYDFPQAGAKIWMSECEESEGQLVVSRLNVKPDAAPNANVSPENYWVLNYYEGGGGFPPLDSIELTPTDAGFVSALPNAGAGILYLRSENGEGDTWEAKAKATRLAGGQVKYDRKSTVTGSAQITLTNGAPVFDEVDPGKVCEADTVPGKLLLTNEASNSTASSPKAPQFGSVQDFSVSVWFKTTSTTSDGVIFGNKDWDSGVNVGWVFSLSSGEIWWNVGDGTNRIDQRPSAPILNDGEWHHFAATCDRDGQSIVYVDGILIDSKPMTNIGNIDNAKKLSFGAADEGDWRIAAEIEEACIYDRVLTQNELRELAHLTRTGAGLPLGIGLVAYFQFNGTGTKEYDRVGDYHLTLDAAATRATSTAPVGGGVSSRMDVTTGGDFTFGNTGVTMGFDPTAGIFPDGEICVSRLNVPPHELPTGAGATTERGYWIVNNFGTNATFDALDSLVLDGVPGVFPTDENAPGNFSIFKRNPNAFGNTWGGSIDGADLVSANGGDLGKITFSTDNGITSFGQFSLGDGRGVELNVKVFLEGPYIAGTMGDALRTTGFLPTGEPYSDLGFAQMNGGGGERFSASTLGTAGADAIVDWVVVELRDPADPATVLYTRSALLQADGDVVDVDGTSALRFDFAIAGNYQVAIRHRNHLGAMSANSVSLSATPASLDFTDGSTPTWGMNAQVDMGGGTFALWAADLDASGTVDAADRSEAWNAREQSGYLSTDADMDGTTDESDRDKSWNNRNLIEQLPE